MKPQSRARLKHLLAGFPLLITFVSAGVWAKPFNDSTLSGSYVLTFSGPQSVLGPITGLGLLTFDGSGAVAGFERLNYPICQGQLSGSYSVNPDGSGSIDLPPFGAENGCDAFTGSPLNFILNDSHGQQMDAFVGLPTDPYKDPSTVSAKLQQRKANPNKKFSLASFSGLYVWSYNGRAADGVQVAGIGTVTSDGMGNVSVAQSFHGGLGSCDGSGDGTYTVNADGSGTLSLRTFWSPGPEPSG
jgi:hypothetical protein